MSWISKLGKTPICKESGRAIFLTAAAKLSVEMTTKGNNILFRKKHPAIVTAEFAVEWQVKILKSYLSYLLKSCYGCVDNSFDRHIVFFRR